VNATVLINHAVSGIAMHSSRTDVVGAALDRVDPSIAVPRVARSDRRHSIQRPQEKPACPLQTVQVVAANRPLDSDSRHAEVIPAGVQRDPVVWIRQLLGTSTDREPSPRRSDEASIKQRNDRVESDRDAAGVRHEPARDYAPANGPREELQRLVGGMVMTRAEHVVRIIGIVQRDRESRKPFLSRHWLREDDATAKTGATVVMRPIKAGGSAPPWNQSADGGVEMVAEEARKGYFRIFETREPAVEWLEELGDEAGGG